MVDVVAAVRGVPERVLTDLPDEFCHVLAADATHADDRDLEAEDVRDLGVPPLELTLAKVQPSAWPTRAATCFMVSSVSTRALNRILCHFARMAPKGSGGSRAPGRSHISAFQWPLVIEVPFRIGQSQMKLATTRPT
ncbi:hypothetical protein GCM10029964_074320 [Kibdelosporangium lantanae]